MENSKGARDVVVDLIIKNKSTSYVEVGCYEGVLLNRVRDLGIKVWGIDPHKVEFNEFDEYRCRMGSDTPLAQQKLDDIANYLSRVFGKDYLRMTSKEAAQQFKNESVDFIFIDAIHDYDHAKEDIQLWLPKVKKGGILAGDDYKTRFPGVCKAVDEMLPERTITGVVWHIQK